MKPQKPFCTKIALPTQIRTHRLRNTSVLRHWLGPDVVAALNGDPDILRLDAKLHGVTSEYHIRENERPAVYIFRLQVHSPVVYDIVRSVSVGPPASIFRVERYSIAVDTFRRNLPLLQGFVV